MTKDEFRMTKENRMTKSQKLGQPRARVSSFFCQCPVTQRAKERFTFSQSGFRHSSPVPRCSRHAFTLVEIMIVVGIISIISAVGIPAIVNSLRKEGMRKAVSDIQEACTYTRAAAIFSGQAAKLVIGPRAKTFSIRASGGDGSAKNLSFTATLPENVHIEILGVNFIEMQDEDQAEVTFQPNGTCDEFAMVLRSDEGEYRKITLDVVTGFPDVEVPK